MLVRVRLAIADAALRARLAARVTGPYCDLAVQDEQQVRKLLHESFDLAVLDAGVADPELLVSLRQLPDRPALVVLEPDETRWAATVAAGADSVLDPRADFDELGSALLALVDRRRERRLERHRANVRAGRPEVELVALSAVMRRAIETARQVAYADSPVLVTGETGVGKERIATLIHGEGPRASGPFVTINCAALPTELFESELFGHAKGSFTGAHRSQRGVFERADRGVLLLDEIGEMPLHLQAKLLRAIQDRQIRPVGADQPVAVDVRIVAATNRDLEAEVAAGRFRRDLYYRLCVVEVRVPPLRERPEDIPALAEAHLRVQRELMGREVESIAKAARTALVRYPWPGNVRELANVIERAVLLCPGQEIGLADLPEAVGRYGPADAVAAALPMTTVEVRPELHTLAAQGGIQLPVAWVERSWKEVRETLLLEGEREYLTALLQQEHGRVGEVARRAGISARALFEKMRRHGLRKEDFRRPRPAPPFEPS